MYNSFLLTVSAPESFGEEDSFRSTPDQEHTGRNSRNSSQDDSVSNPDLAKENFAMDWTDIIGRSLKEFLEQ